MTSRVKVSKEALLRAVRERREKTITAHAEAYQAAVAKRHAIAKKVAKALRDAASAAEKGNLPDSGYNYLQVPWEGRLPSQPEEECNTSRIDRLIATLEMVTEPTISISADDAAEYLG